MNVCECVLVGILLNCNIETLITLLCLNRDKLLCIQENWLWQQFNIFYHVTTLLFFSKHGQTTDQ